jgi:hypothetical protein
MKRKTLGKPIAAARTFADKWQVIMDGGAPITELEKIVFEAVHFRTPSAHGIKWQTEAEARLKARFAEALFPALVRGDKKPFKQLLELMGPATRHGGNTIDYLLERNGVVTPTKKLRRHLKKALINIPTDDRISLKAACDFLKMYDIEPRDESDVWHTLQELGLPLLRPGDRAQWYSKGKLVRELRVGENGKLTNIGMTRAQIEAHAGCLLYRELSPTRERSPIVK